MSEINLTLNVKIKDGWTVITSPDVDGLFVGCPDEDWAFANVPASIKKLSELNKTSHPWSDQRTGGDDAEN